MTDLIYVKKVMLLKVIATKNIWFVAISFSIMGLNLKIVSVMVVIIWKLSLNFSVTAIITVKNIDYYCVTHDISKPEAIHLLEN